MANVCIKSGVLTNTAEWNHNGCFTYATTRALCVLQFMVAWLILLPIITPTSTTWVGSLYCHPHSLVATNTWLSLYQDSMAIIRQYGKPDLFITMTCNPKWEEIVNALKPDEIANDCPYLVTSVFVGKL
jgi:hypothetical protein